MRRLLGAGEQAGKGMTEAGVQHGACLLEGSQAGSSSARPSVDLLVQASVHSSEAGPLTCIRQRPAEPNVSPGGIPRVTDEDQGRQRGGTQRHAQPGPCPGATQLCWAREMQTCVFWGAVHGVTGSSLDHAASGPDWPWVRSWPAVEEPRPCSPHERELQSGLHPLPALFTLPPARAGRGQLRTC